MAPRTNTTWLTHLAVLICFVAVRLMAADSNFYLPGVETQAPLPTFTMPPSPTAMPAPPPPQNQERRGGQGAAAAAAMAAAGMQAMTCMMMMKEAQNAVGSEKQMMMMMAMQQCAQAAQSAANGAENKDGEKKLSQAEPTKQPEASPEPYKPPEQKQDQKLEIPETASNESTAPADDMQLPEYKLPEAPGFTTPATATTEAVDFGNLGGGVATSIPGRIENAKLDYDNSGKSSENATPTRDLGLGTSIIGANANGNGTGVQGYQTLDEKRRRGAGGQALDGASDDGGSAAGGGAAGAPAQEAGNSPLDAMLAMLGGSPEGGNPMNGSDILVPPKPGADGIPTANIFEYASHRYRILAEQKNIHKSIKPGRKTASVK